MVLEHATTVYFKTQSFIKNMTGGFIQVIFYLSKQYVTFTVGKAFFWWCKAFYTKKILKGVSKKIRNINRLAVYVSNS